MGDSISEIIKEIKIPKMFCVKQKFNCECIHAYAIPCLIDTLLSDNKYKTQIKSGMNIAITAGSREISNGAIIIKSVADYVRKMGANPFIVPAMGSHGGSTGEGQQEILVSYGITLSHE